MTHLLQSASKINAPGTLAAPIGSALPSKPQYTKPCNHCGLCCQLSLCHIAEKAFPNQKAPCPALCIGKDGALCGLVMMEEATKMKPMIRQHLGIGVGCSMPDETTTQAEIEAFDKYAMRVVYGQNPKSSGAA